MQAVVAWDARRAYTYVWTMCLRVGFKGQGPPLTQSVVSDRGLASWGPPAQSRAAGGSVSRGGQSPWKPCHVGQLSVEASSANIAAVRHSNSGEDGSVTQSETLQLPDHLRTV
jgi:hypothetical protein